MTCNAQLTWCNFVLQDDVGYTWSLPVDAAAILQDSSLTAVLPDLSEQLRNQPERVLNTMALAFHTVCVQRFAESMQQIARPKVKTSEQ